MFSVLTKDLDYAVQTFKELRPDASKMAVSGFRTKAKNHLRLFKCQRTEGVWPQWL